MSKEHHLAVVVIGHAGSGKSSVAGHLIYNYGDAMVGIHPTRILRAFKFETPRFRFTLLDVPGDRKLIKNAITGISHADVALLVVSAAKDEFEASYAKTGQLREHALLAFALGVKQIVVAVTKVEDESRFTEIKDEVSKFLSKVGFKGEVPFVQVSGWDGSNIHTRSESPDWYKGPVLVDVLDSTVVVPERPVNSPLRLSVQDACTIEGVGTVVLGRVQAGVLKVGMTVVFSPSQVTSTVKSIEIHDERVESAGPGDYVGFRVEEDVCVKDVKRGTVVGDADNDPPVPCERFEARMVVLDHPNRIHPGYTPVLSCHGAHIACRIDKLLRLLNKRSGEPGEENPKFLKSGNAAICELVPSKPMCVETFYKYASLGRFVIRDLNRAVAVGVIQAVHHKASAAAAAAASK